MSEAKIEVLIVEDNFADRVLFEECARQVSVAANLRFAKDGEEALEMLRRGPKPHCLLLDLNLPRKDGRELLLEIKADVQLKDIPVTVMSTSSSTEDEKRAYALGAERYLVKPNDFYKYQEFVEELLRGCLAARK